MILGIILLLFWIILLPFALGAFLFPGDSEAQTKADVFEHYALGIVVVFAIFELITVPVTFMKGSLTLVTWLWAGSCIALALAGGIHRFRKEKNGKMFRFSFHLKRKISGWEVGTLVLILFQIIYVALQMHIDDDDAWYAGTAVASYATDTINRIYPYTGEWMSAFPSDYTLSPYPIFYAMLGRLTGIHPTILMHTIMPVVLIALSYMVYRLIAHMVFHGNEKQAGQMMFFIALFQLFGNYSVRSASTFLLVRIWQGKATLCNIMIPLTIYLFMQVTEYENRKNWIALFLCVVAGTMVSSMGVFLLPVLLASMSFVAALRYKKIKQMFYTVLCILPCVVQFGIFYFVLR